MKSIENQNKHVDTAEQQSVPAVSRFSASNAYVTISVDDGHPLDLLTSDLLTKYGIAATFYAPARNPERRVLTPPQLRQIATGFEIGSHTLNHIPLTTVSDERAWLEISEGKAWLEDVLGKAVSSFCYPRGKYTRKIVNMVERAGFTGARTCALNRTDFPDSPFHFGVSTQAHNHGRAIQVRHALIERNFQGIMNFIRVHHGARQWEMHFEHALDLVELEGGIAHLTMHSWEIDDNGDWAKFEAALKAIANRKGLHKVTNGELYTAWADERQRLSEQNITKAQPTT
jgi:peptidoglycan/xylan/chitin deacetylase (PgdA/CDA1 family)